MDLEFNVHTLDRQFRNVILVCMSEAKALNFVALSKIEAEALKIICCLSASEFK